MTEKRGYEVQADAFAEFDAWVAAQPDYVQNMSMLDQIILYRDSSRPSLPRAAIGLVLAAAAFALALVLTGWLVR